MTNLKKWLLPISFINIYVIWGLTFIAISFGLNGFPPFILSGFRFLIAGALIFGFLLTKGEKANSLINWKKNAIVGILILTGGTGLVGWGEQYITASEAAIAIATGPFWFIVVDKKNWRSHFSDKLILTGLLIGFIGLIYFLNGSINSHSQHSSKNSNRIIAFAVLAFSSISWVFGSLYSKSNPSSNSNFMNIAQQLIVAGISSLIIAVFTNEWAIFSFTAIPQSAWFGLVFLILFGSIIAYMSYIWLLSEKPAVVVSTHTYINPIVTVIAGLIITNEEINRSQFAGLAIILIGVLLTNFTKYFKLSKRTKVKLRRTKNSLINVGYLFHQYPQKKI